MLGKLVSLLTAIQLIFSVGKVSCYSPSDTALIATVAAQSGPHHIHTGGHANGGNFMVFEGEHQHCGHFYPSHCNTHQIDRNSGPLVQKLVYHGPVAGKAIRFQKNHLTDHVPVITNHEETIVRHVPVVERYIKPVIETRTRQVPVTKTITRTIVEPYITHIPVTEKYIKPVHETIVRQVPIVEKRLVPVIHEQIKHIPVIEKKTRPKINIPLKPRVIRNLLDQFRRSAPDELPDLYYTSGESLVGNPNISCMANSPYAYRCHNSIKNNISPTKQ